MALKKSWNFHAFVQFHLFNFRSLINNVLKNSEFELEPLKAFVLDLLTSYFVVVFWIDMFHFFKQIFNMY